MNATASSPLTGSMVTPAFTTDVWIVPSARVVATTARPLSAAASRRTSSRSAISSPYPEDASAGSPTELRRRPPTRLGARAPGPLVDQHHHKDARNEFVTNAGVQRQMSGPLVGPEPSAFSAVTRIVPPTSTVAVVAVVFSALRAVPISVPSAPGGAGALSSVTT